jgi:hypothetical protein
MPTGIIDAITPQPSVDAKAIAAKKSSEDLSIS